MTSVMARSFPVVPLQAQEFADSKGISGYLGDVINLARQAFPALAVSVTLGHDAEDETHKYIALEIDASDASTDELLAGQRAWSEGIGRVCLSVHAVYFVLSWR